MKNYPNWMFGLVKGQKIDSLEVDGGSDGRLCFSVRERGKVWTNYMEIIMND